MLIYVNTRHDCGVTAIPGKAHVVIALDAIGATKLEAFVDGALDSSYCRMGDERLLQRELPKLLAELQAQLQASSGSAVTEACDAA